MDRGSAISDPPGKRRRLAENVCRSLPRLAGRCGGQRARKGQGLPVGRGRGRQRAVAFQAPEKALHRVTASQMRSSLILIERPSREEPDRGLALSFGPLAGDSGAAVLFSRFWQSQAVGSDSVRNPADFYECAGLSRRRPNVVAKRTFGGQGCRGQTKGRETWTTYHPAFSFVGAGSSGRVSFRAIREVTTLYVL
jgi:hypothetical protein